MLRTSVRSGTGGPKIGELISHLLEAPIVVFDREIALGDAVELDVKEKRARLTVPQKLCLQCDPKIANSGAAVGDGFGKVIREGAGDPGLCHAVHVSPVRGGIGLGVEQNVILKRELAGGEQKLITLASVVTGVDVEGSWDQTSDVLDRDGLGVEVEDSGSLMQQHGVVEITL